MAVGVLMLPRSQGVVDPDYSTPSGQPIEFSHELHAGTLEMSCAACHTGVLEARVARVPSVRRCLDCHEAHKGWDDVVAVDPRSDEAAWSGDASARRLVEVGKLRWYGEERASIPWRKVYDVPDHVQFDHLRHVRLGVSCTRCHGDVTHMATAVRVRRMGMKFCVDCHMESRIAEPDRASGAGIAGDVYRPAPARERLQRREPATWRAADPGAEETEETVERLGLSVRQAPFDCATCHM